MSAAPGREYPVLKVDHAWSTPRVEVSPIFLEVGVLNLCPQLMGGLTPLVGEGGLYGSWILGAAVFAAT